MIDWREVYWRPIEHFGSMHSSSDRNVSENQAGGGTEDGLTVSWGIWEINWIAFGDGLDSREDYA